MAPINSQIGDHSKLTIFRPVSSNDRLLMNDLLDPNPSREHVSYYNTRRDWHWQVSQRSSLNLEETRRAVHLLILGPLRIDKTKSHSRDSLHVNYQAKKRNLRSSPEQETSNVH